jgi:DNA-binding NarL/FixJ family response regulator
MTPVKEEAPLPSEPAWTFRLEHHGEEFLVLSEPLLLPPRETLTPAELDVARAIVRGASNGEIARVRGTSVRTVANQVASILRRLGVGSRAQVAAKLANVDFDACPPERPPSDSTGTVTGRCWREPTR